MPFWHRAKTLWRNLTRKQRVENDLDAEIRAYREMLEDEKRAAGVDAAAARREALLDLGGAEQIKEEVRAVRLGFTLESIAIEVRQAVRGLGRNSGLTALGTAMLALGIGASTVVFSIFYAALVQPLPFRDSERLVQVWETRLYRDIDRAPFAEANFWDVRSRNRSFLEMAACHDGDANLTGLGQAEKVTLAAVTAGFFRTLGVRPVLGRDFTDDDGRLGPDSAVVIAGYRFWQTHFGGDPKILGKTLRLDDKAYTVIGVLPPGEPWLNQQLYQPFGYRPSTDRGSWEYPVIGRLKPGVTMAAAMADVEGIAKQIERDHPRETKGIGFRMEPASKWVASDATRRALWVLLGAVTFLLLIACLNLANLLLARGMSRQREIAVRTALGAGRARLVRFVMLESLLIGGFGASLGTALAFAGLRAIHAWEVQGVPRLADAGLNPWVLGFTALLALLTGLLSGWAPAWQVNAGSIIATLRDSDRQTGSRKQARLRSVLVAGEVALSFVLLVGAGLLIRSFSELLHVDRGFDTQNRLLFSVGMPQAYWNDGVGKNFLDRFLERLRAMPEVVAAGAVSQRPIEGGDPGMGIDAASPTQHLNTIPWAGWRIVSPGYFQAAGLRLLRGRYLDEHDPSIWADRGQPQPPRRVMISERLAKLVFPEGNAVGKHALLWKGQSNREAEVVGVVADSRERGPANQPTLTVYLPFGSNALTGEFVVHTHGNPKALLPTVRAIVNSLDANLPISDVRSFEEVVHRSVAPQQLNAVLLGIFSGLALLLATTGIYGVISYSMSRRTSEIGLRVALGASAGSILGMAIRQGMRPALIGIALGAAGAWWLSSYFATLLFEIQPFDAITYAGVAVLLLATALLACYVPGRRAMRTDPAVALRVE